MVVFDDTRPEPVDVVDRLLWRDAQHMLDRHATADATGRCAWCGRAWPCPARRLAEHAQSVAVAPRGAQPTRSDPRGPGAARDPHGPRTLPGRRADLVGAAAVRTPRHAAPNSGAFD